MGSDESGEVSPTRYQESIRLFTAAQGVIAGGVSSNFRLGGSPVPLFFKKGQGARLYDVDGNTYIDYALGMGPDVLGHAPPSVVSALTDSLAIGQLFAGQHAGELELGERLLEVIPFAELVRFGLSGSEMVQAALRVARAVTERSQVVKFEGHYHGWLDSILVSVNTPVGASDQTSFSRWLPSAGQSAAAASDVAILPWNDIEVLRDHLELHGVETAAVIMEPILCNTSVIVPRTGYLRQVRELCDAHNVVLIFDEVITGFRVALGGAQERLGVTPDLAVFAKALGGGFPIAVLAGRRSLMEHIGNGSVMHGGTFNANVQSCYAALAVLNELTSESGRALRDLEARGDLLIAGLRDLGSKSGLPLVVQGLGSVFNTAFAGAANVIDYRSYLACDADRQRRFLAELQDRGVRPTGRGTWFLATAHTDRDIETTLEAVEGALQAMQT